MKQHILLWCLLTVLIPGAVNAAAPPFNPVTSISPNTIVRQDTLPVFADTLHSLREVVVSANRFTQTRRDIPQQTMLLPSAQLAFDNQLTSADVMMSTGNILVQKSQLGGGSPILRGFETNKVLLVVDGVRMNNTIYRAGHLQNIITLDNAVMDRVEVLFGPGSVMYGSDALGGVMHFITKKPLFSDDGSIAIHGNAFARYSTAASEKTAHADVSIGGGKLASLTSITYSDFGDLVQGSKRKDAYPDFGKRTFYVERQGEADVSILNPDPDEQVGSAYSQYDLLQKFVYKPGAFTTHTLNLQYSNSSDVPRYDRLTQGTPEAPTYAEWYYGPQARFFASYQLGLTGEKGLFANGAITAGYQAIEESRHDRRFNSANRNHRTENLDILTLNADFTRKTEESSWSYGLEATYNHVESSAYRENINTGAESPIDTRYPDGGSDVVNAAVYIANTYTVAPTLLLQGGLRFSYYSLSSKFEDKTFFPFPYDEVKQSGPDLTGSLGTVWTPGDGWRFTAMAATGFRAPSVDDMSKVFESVPGNVIVPNPELGPEHTVNVDVSVSKNFNEQIEIGVEGYYTWYYDAITTAPGTFNGSTEIIYNDSLSRVTTNVNANKAFIYGANAYVNFHITRSLTLYSTLNYTYGRIRTDTTPYPLDHIPPLFGKTSLRFNSGKWRAEAYAMYNAWKKLKGYNLYGEDNFSFATPDGMPSWLTLNLKGSYALTDNLIVQAGIENILDTNYRVFASNISAPGRNLYVTLRARW